MGTYTVQLSAPDGARLEAVFNAPSLPALEKRLRQQEYTLLRVLPPSADVTLRRASRRIREVEVVTALHQLSASLKNGVSLQTALASIARDTGNPVLRAVLIDIESLVRSGDDLSSACAGYPDLFPDLYVRMLEAGERGERLGPVLEQIAFLAEQSMHARQRITTALVYPATLCVFTMVVLLAVFTFTVPTFTSLFEELGVRSLPLATQALLWLRNVGFPLLVFAAPLVALLFVFLARFVRIDGNRFGVWLRNRLPIVSAVYHELALMRLAGTLSAMAGSGVPILEALRLAGGSSESPALQGAMWTAIPLVAEGETLSASLARSGLLPATFCSQVAAAEAVGDLPAALRRLAVWHQGRVDYLAGRMNALIEPVVVTILALGAGWVAVALFSPVLGIIRSLSGG